MRLGLNGLSLSKPSQADLEASAASASSAGPNHLLVGASEAFEAPSEVHYTRVSDGWIEDFDSAKIGEGKDAYVRARDAIKSWRHMSLGWVETNQPAIKLGSSVCIAAKMLCFWQRNPLEIVYVSEDGPRAAARPAARLDTETGRIFRFGQTTLKGHALAGEESFAVRWKPDDSVWYEVYAFSRAKTVLALVAYPVRRFFQRKFRRDSARAVAAAVRQAPLLD